MSELSNETAPTTEGSSLPDVVIVDTGCANITSVLCAIERLGARVTVSADPQVIKAASRVIIPGVGTASQAMHNISAKALAPVLQSLTQPVLGICLGMQLMTSHSTEGDVECLGLIPGQVARLEAHGERLPHMGWNTLEKIVRGGAAHPILRGFADTDYVYFVHSFAVEPSAQMLAACTYGSRFAAVIGARNFIGMQFHPERSSKAGAQLLKNFLSLSASELWVD